MKFLCFLIFFLCLFSVTALNESHIIDESLGNWTWNEAICEEELQSCRDQTQLLLDEYNNLSKDYHEGAICGTVVYLLRDNNMLCGKNLKNCREDVGKYRFGFWFFLSMLFIIAIIFLYKGLIKSSGG